MNKLKLWNIQDDYINYLIEFEEKVFSNKEEDRKKERKYLGTVLHINNLKYFVPLSSPKNTDYIWINGEKVIRKSIIPIIRIVAKDNLGNDELKGTLKFSNMIPVPDSALINYDVYKEKDEDYKILITKEIAFIKGNSAKIIKNAEVIYKQKIKKYNINYLKDTVDFLLLEQKCKEYEAIKQDFENTYHESAATTESNRS